jgi:hypothetical protein
MPGGWTVPPPLSASVPRFKMQFGALRRVRKNITRKQRVPTPTGGKKTLRIRDHVLVGFHLLRRPKGCRRGYRWRITAQFPTGTETATGTQRCLKPTIPPR